MRNIFKEAERLNEFGTIIPMVEIGQIIELGDIWDGKGELPEISWALPLNELDSINYEFDIIEENEIPHKTSIKIMSVDII